MNFPLEMLNISGKDEFEINACGLSEKQSSDSRKTLEQEEDIVKKI